MNIDSLLQAHGLGGAGTAKPGSVLQHFEYQQIDCIKIDNQDNVYVSGAGILRKFDKNLNHLWSVTNNGLTQVYVFPSKDGSKVFIFGLNGSATWIKEYDASTGAFIRTIESLAAMNTRIVYIDDSYNLYAHENVNSTTSYLIKYTRNGDGTYTTTYRVSIPIYPVDTDEAVKSSVDGKLLIGGKATGGASSQVVAINLDGTGAVARSCPETISGNGYRVVSNPGDNSYFMVNSALQLCKYTSSNALAWRITIAGAASVIPLFFRQGFLFVLIQDNNNGNVYYIAKINPADGAIVKKHPIGYNLRPGSHPDLNKATLWGVNTQSTRIFTLL